MRRADRLHVMRLLDRVAVVDVERVARHVAREQRGREVCGLVADEKRLRHRPVSPC